MQPVVPAPPGEPFIRLPQPFIKTGCNFGRKPGVLASMTSTSCRPTRFVPATGRLTAKTSKLIALGFSRAIAAVSLRSFVVISCVAGGSFRAPLCFGPARRVGA